MISLWKTSKNIFKIVHVQHTDTVTEAVTASVTGSQTNIFLFQFEINNLVVCL